VRPGRKSRDLSQTQVYPADPIEAAGKNADLTLQRRSRCGVGMNG